MSFMAILANNLVQAAEAQPEYGRIADVERLFGLKRSTLYLLTGEGKIRAVTVRPKNSRVGVKLIDLGSVRRFLADEIGRAAP